MIPITYLHVNKSIPVIYLLLSYYVAPFLHADDVVNKQRKPNKLMQNLI